MEGPAQAQSVKRRAPSASTTTGVNTTTTANPSADLSSISTPTTSSSSSSRVTRSAARQAAEASKAPAEPQESTGSLKPLPATRKRKATAPAGESPDAAPDPDPDSISAAPARRTKRPRVTATAEAPSTSTRPEPDPPAPRVTRQATNKTKMPQAMSASNDSGPSNETPSSAANPPPPKSSRRRSERAKKSTTETPAREAGSTSKRSKKARPGADGDVRMTDAPTKASGGRTGEEASKAPHWADEMPDHMGRELDDDDDEDDLHDGYGDDDDDDDEDAFSAGYLAGAGHPPPGIASTLRALSGMMSGVASRLRDILANLQQKEDDSMRLIALQELSEMLLVSTEDNLAGHFSPDPFVKELVALMESGGAFGEENPEMMLLACRCIANLMEALPSSTANIVYGGAVPILCQKLLEIHYIDLAEQALSVSHVMDLDLGDARSSQGPVVLMRMIQTLEKVSVEFPTTIVREGGLTACLTYLDFFPTSTQRTAVTTAANCCRNLSEDSFPTVRDVMPILLNVLGSNDQKVVEQACLCVCRIVESFRFRSGRLEELVSPELLKAITRLLLPGTTNLIGPHIHTQFLRVLAHTARASPKLSVDLLKMGVVDTLYQILTGVSPPAGDDADVATEIDRVMVMQALIHRPREQVLETLNVICELLPSLPKDADLDSVVLSDALKAAHASTRSLPTSSSQSEAKDQRKMLLAGCQQELTRFATVLLPTLTDTYSSTVNRSVRQKVLTAQLKMLSNLDTSILEEALRNVSYASFLAAMLSQQDHPTLVYSALVAADLLITRLEHVYRYHFHREGVVAEIAKLTELGADDPSESANGGQTADGNKNGATASLSSSKNAGSSDDHGPVVPDEMDDRSDGDDDDSDGENDEDHDMMRDDLSASPVSSHDSSLLAPRDPRLSGGRAIKLERYVAKFAARFMAKHESGEKGNEPREQAAHILDDLRKLASEMRERYLGDGTGDGLLLFQRLAHYFVGDALESITSYELLQSGIVQLLLDMFSNPAGEPVSRLFISPSAQLKAAATEKARLDARAAFLEVFMGTEARHDGKSFGSKSPITPFSAVVHKLQDLLSRAEHFEVVTINPSGSDGGQGSAASMLAKQLRLKLVADDDPAIPRAFRSFLVSIHAIATFKSLDDYLRPRLAGPDRPKGSRQRDSVNQALAAYAAAAGLPHPRLTERISGNAAASTSTSTPPPPPPAPAAPMAPTPPTASTGRSLRKSTRTKGASSTNNTWSGNVASTPTTSNTPVPASETKPAGPRRSSRKQQSAKSSSAAAPPPPVPSETRHRLEPLECADEKRMPDSPGDNLDDNGALEAILGELDDAMDEGPPAEPSAVHMEVASSGKVTARKEDGTRVATPSQVSATSSQTTPSLPTSKNDGTPSASGSNPGLPTRHRSYAAATQSVPQDWHLEFSIGDQPVSSDSTIYRAVQRQFDPTDVHSSRNIWSGIHTIKIKRVPGPPPAETSASASIPEGEGRTVTSDLPDSLHKNSITSAILRLLDLLHALNANIDDVLVENRPGLKLHAEPVAQFVNTKLTAKLNRQLEEPLIVASNCLPSWSEDLARLYPFLFPFETRHLFLRSTSFGYSRSMTRWQTSRSGNDGSRADRLRDERAFLGRLQRQKVRISRKSFFESALKVMNLYGHSPSVLEVEYFDEVGTGLGPTLEFYSTVSKDFSKSTLKLWREDETQTGSEYIFSKRGLFPAPMSDEQARSDNGQKILNLFRTLGRFVARSMLDSRIIDISFNPTFFRMGDGITTVSPSLGAVRTVDEGLARSLKLLKQFANVKAEIDANQLLGRADRSRAIRDITIQGVGVEDLGLDFTLPGHPSIELQPHGANTTVTIENVGEYVDRVIDLTLGSGVQRQVDAFRSGFSAVFPYSALRAFTPDELVMLFGRVDEDWSIETLMDSIKADHGFNMDSKSVKNLLQTMSEFSVSDRREFLQFVTGSPKLPIGGFKSLTPMFTVVCKPSEPPFTSDDYLPSVMTCVNYLKLPDYSTVEMMRQRLKMAISEGQGAFHLS